jgi:hypothetical protein
LQPVRWRLHCDEVAMALVELPKYATSQQRFQLSRQ